MCKFPFVKDGNAFGCGQCLPCRINRRRLWTHRMVLEALKHDASCFVTLTYSDEHLPPGGNLVPRDMQLFLKRIRKRLEPLTVRFYGVGEYGDQTFRPHYHLALFGVPVDAAQLVADAWTKGHVAVGSLTFESAGYIAGYVTKKMTKPDDARLDGRHPEFARMSLRPGIGADSMDDLADVLMTKHGSAELAALGDVPTSLKHGGRSMPLGRYLRRKLREKIGAPELGLESPACQEQRQELSALFAAHAYPSYLQNAPESVKRSYYQTIIVEKNKGKIRSFETKYKIFKQEKTL